MLARFFRRGLGMLGQQDIRDDLSSDIIELMEIAHTLARAETALLTRLKSWSAYRRGAGARPTTGRRKSSRGAQVTTLSPHSLHKTRWNLPVGRRVDGAAGTENTGALPCSLAHA